MRIIPKHISTMVTKNAIMIVFTFDSYTAFRVQIILEKILPHRLSFLRMSRSYHRFSHIGYALNKIRFSFFSYTLRTLQGLSRLVGKCFLYRLSLLWCIILRLVHLRYKNLNAIDIPCSPLASPYSVYKSPLYHHLVYSCWCFEHFLYAPPSYPSITESAIIYTLDFCPFGKCMCFTFISDFCISLCVIQLSL